MKLFSNDESEAKPGCVRFKEAAPQVRLSCPENSQGRNDGKSVPKDLLQLSQLVGNPYTQEHVWMNACIGAGDRSLAPKHSVLFKAFSMFKTSLGTTYGMLTLTLNFVLGLFFAAQSACSMRGISVDDFVRPFSTIDGAGFLIALLAGSCFWAALLSKSRVLRLLTLVPSILLLSFALVFGTASFIGFGWALATAVLGITGVVGVWHAGLLCRESLPIRFNAAKLAQSSIGMLTVPAVLSAWILYQALTSPSHSSTYNNGTSWSLAILGSIFSYCLLAQGYAIARASKSASKAACAFLGVCVQAPLLLGLFYAASLSTIVATMANIDPNFSASLQSTNFSSNFDAWKVFGLERSMFMFAVTATTLGLAGLGGYLGACRNTIFQSRAKS